eukprot:9490309-Pyramimonas_sp.AAC.2
MRHGRHVGVQLDKAHACRGLGPHNSPELVNATDPHATLVTQTQAQRLRRAACIGDLIQRFNHSSLYLGPSLPGGRHEIDVLSRGTSHAGKRTRYCNDAPENAQHRNQQVLEVCGELHARVLCVVEVHESVGQTEHAANLFGCDFLPARVLELAQER